MLHHQHKTSSFIMRKGKHLKILNLKLLIYGNLLKLLVISFSRTKWEIEITAKGQAGHGMLLLKNTAGEKLHSVIDKFFKFRKGESENLESNPKLTIGDVTTVNLTMISGGTQGNVVPPEMSAVIDCRIANDVDFDAFERMVNYKIRLIKSIHFE